MIHILLQRMDGRYCCTALEDKAMPQRVKRYLNKDKYINNNKLLNPSARGSVYWRGP
jgi:hypothetical protein